MPKEPFALSTISPASPEEDGDYDAIYATVMESARGRWFLEEYAHRNRNADTKLVLAAIERIESLIRGERSQQEYHGIRTELLEMAEAIAETRAEVTGEQEADVQGQPAERDTKRLSARAEILAMAERLHDVAWTMRERSLDPATCEEIERLAYSILAASSLQDPAPHRVQKLKEVLRYLERRIGGMLDAGAQVGAIPAEELAEKDEPHADIGAASSDAGLVARLGPHADTNETGASDNEDVRPAEKIETRGAAGEARNLKSDDPAPIELQSFAPPPIPPNELASTALPDEAAVAQPDVPAIIAAAEIDPPLLASGDASDSPGELQLDPLVIEPQPQAELPAASPAQQERVSADQASNVLLESQLDIWGTQPAAASAAPEEPSLDLILVIEQELFVPAPIECPGETTTGHIRAAPRSEPVSGIPQADARPSPAAAAAPVEQVAPRPAPPSQPIAPAFAAPVGAMARPMPRAAQSDPLAALKAMTSEERIALFT
jgi:hypothetical protein